MKFIHITNKDKEIYEAFVNNHKYATPLQMWEWASFRNRLGKKLFERVGIIDDKKILHLTATFQISSFKSLGNVLYIPQGPLWDTTESLKMFAKEILKYSKQKRCFAVIIEPRVIRNSKCYQALVDVGFTYSDKAVQPRNTVFVELDRTEDELLKSFSKTTRYNIRYAKRKGVVIKRYNLPEDISRIAAFYSLLKETQKRSYFHIQHISYFEQLWKEFTRNKHSYLYEAYYQDILLHSLLVLKTNKTAISLYSASSRKHSNVKATYFTRWKSILDAKEDGCRIYDFFGATSSDDSSHPFYHTTQFKLGFGRKVAEYSGTFEIIVNPIKYTIWNTLEKLQIFAFYEESFLRNFKKQYGRQKEERKTA